MVPLQNISKGAITDVQKNPQEQIKLAQEIGQAKAAKELGISKNTSIHGHAHNVLDIWILGAARKHRRVP